jgi:hypothetical protein
MALPPPPWVIFVPAAWPAASSSEPKYIGMPNLV